MRAISWFAGIGGFDAALVDAGHEVVGACEIDEACRRVYGARFGEPAWFPRDLLDVRPQDVPDADLWVGGPPCQSFSVAGRRAGMEDARGNLFLQWLALAAVRQPPMMLIENVPGLLSSTSGADFGAILSVLASQGRCVAWTVLDARWFGVAQRRRRVFIVASLSGDPRAALFDSPESAPLDGGSADAVLIDGRWQSLQTTLLGDGDAPFCGASWPTSGYVRDDRCWTRDVVEWREPRVTASLADVLVRGEVPARYYLSARACEGILRRAERRGRELPAALMAALEGTAGGLPRGESSAELVDLSEVAGPLLSPTTGSGGRVDADGAASGHLIVGTLAASGAGSVRPAGQKNEPGCEGGVQAEARADGTVNAVRSPGGGASHQFLVVSRDSTPKTADGLVTDLRAGNPHMSAVLVEPPVTASLRASDGHHGRCDNLVLAIEAPGRKTSGGRKVGTGVRTGEAYTLDADPRAQAVFQQHGSDGFASAQGGTVVAQQPIPFDTTQITSAANRSAPQVGAPCHPLAAGVHPPAVAFSSKDHGADAGSDAPTLRAAGHDVSHANGGAPPAVVEAGSVRRLTPMECERLQGFLDDWTCLCGAGADWRACSCADGPRYRALGNAVAVPVVAWIARRLVSVLR